MSLPGGHDNERQWNLECAMRGHAPYYKGFPVTSATLRDAWVFGTTKASDKFHLPDAAFAAWRWGKPPLFGVRTRCNLRYVQFRTSMEPPEHISLCDDCVLIDLRQPTVYRFYDSADRLLYVGFSICYLDRFEQHALPSSPSTEWWPLQVRHTVVHYEDGATALAAERHAIRTEGPIYNRRSNPRYRAQASA